MLGFEFKKRLLISIILILGLGLICNLVYAVELLRIDQAKVRLSIAPGYSQAGTITIDNPSSETQSVQIYLQDWHYLPAADGTKKFVEPNSTTFSCAPWISFSPAELSLPPFSRAKVNYTVRVPPEARGGYYAVLFFENLLGQAETEGEVVNVSLAVRMAVLFYVEAEGTVERSGSIDNFSLEIQPDDILLLNADFSNTGNVDVAAGGTFNIIDREGMVYARGEINNIYTFPGEGAKLMGSSSKANLPPGRYDLVVTLDLGKALSDTARSRGPILVKEALLEIGNSGQILDLGELR
ncbi:MAG: hypothetical protein ABIC18_04735 [Candidatus Omnitrophota bacterium]